MKAKAALKAALVQLKDEFNQENFQRYQQLHDLVRVEETARVLIESMPATTNPYKAAESWKVIDGYLKTLDLPEEVWKGIVQEIEQLPRQLDHVSIMPTFAKRVFAMVLMTLAEAVEIKQKESATINGKAE